MVLFQAPLLTVVHELIDDMLHVEERLDDELLYGDLAEVDHDVSVLLQIAILLQEGVWLLLLYFLIVAEDRVLPLEPLNTHIGVLLGLLRLGLRARELFVDAILVIDDVYG